MRPQRLVIRAFGPYASEAIINFDCLGERTLFLIHGPTGGGKTTILDAISYALYGETSGGEREGQAMRCDLADPSVLTEIELDFRLGKELYRVQRRPRQVRPKKRGEGFVEEQTTALLYRRSNCKKEEEEGELLAAKARSVTEEIEKLLGFTAAQFRQVVILPQGKFRQLLIADSKERQAILDALFQTGFYRLVEERLKEKAKEAAREMGDLQQKRTLLLQQLSLEEESQLAVLSEEREGDRSLAKKELDLAREKEREAGENLAASRRAKEKLDELESAQKALSELEERNVQIDEERQRLALAKRASLLVDLRSNKEERKLDQDKAKKSLSNAQAAEGKAIKELEEATSLLEKEESRGKEREEARKEAAHLANLQDSASSLDEAKEALSRCEENTKRAQEMQNKCKDRVNELEDNLVKRKKALEQAKEAVSQLDNHQNAWIRAKEELSRKLEMDELEKELLVKEKSFARSSSQEAQGQKELAGLLQCREGVEKSYREGQAARLALQLEEGKACPVCGSKDHPAPAKSDEEIPSDDNLEECRAAVTLQEKNLAKLREEKNSLQNELTRLSTEIESRKRLLGEGANEPCATFENRVTIELANVEAAKLASRQMATIEKAIDLLEKELTEKKEELSVCEKTLTERIADERSARSIVKEREERLPKDLRGEGQLLKALKLAKEKVEELDRALETKKAHLGKCKEEKASKETATKNAKKTLEAAQKSYEELEKRFLDRLHEAGFSTPEELKRAELKQSEIEALEKLISDFDGSMKAAKKRLERSQELAKDLVVPDMAKIEEEHRSKKKALEEAIAQLTKINEEIEQLNTVAKEIANAHEREKKLHERYGALGRVTDLVTGKNELGMTLERYVLASLLETVLDAATQRLQYMSRKRFILQRCRERQDKRLAGGLDLEIFDNYTGTARPAASLSGGESFLASLSLALGLADVVQSAAGGLRLETIFVDEGFGSLDPEALDWAFRALVDLQAGGRLVGIISHVPELKERIDTRLEISSGQKGSTATFVVP